MHENLNGVSGKRAELGQLLQQTREQKGISLAEVEEAIRIRQRYIQDMEEGEFNRLPSEVIARGFLRNYAAYLGLDVGEIFSQYREALPSNGFNSYYIPPETVPAWRLQQKAVDVDLSNRGLPIARMVMVLVLIGIIGIGSWRFLRDNPDFPGGFIMAAAPVVTATSGPTTPTDSSDGPPLAVSENETPQVTEQPTATPTVRPQAPLILPTHTPTPQPTPTDTPPPPGVAASASQIEIVLRITARSWVQATVDGNQEFAGLLEAGQEARWQAVQWMRLDIGNAGGVELILNGESRGILGQPGAVVRRTWMLQGDQILEFDAE